jgi:ubiquinone/menaquinone biosynthesis C-methylase UbiE
VNVFDSQDVATAYDGRRVLPDVALAETLAFIEEFVEDPACIVDIGCGTGRFLPMLASRYRACLVGVEPAQAMIDIAAGRKLDDVGFVRGTAESLPLTSESADLVYVSMVMHHLDSLSEAMRSISRVLRPGGSLVIRNATTETRGDTLHVRFFPEIRELSWLTIPSRGEIVRAAGETGLCLVEARAIPQIHALTYGAYWERIARRPLSDLLTISDEAFAAGCRRLRTYCASRWDEGPVRVPIDHLVLRKPGPQSSVCPRVRAASPR